MDLFGPEVYFYDFCGWQRRVFLKLKVDYMWEEFFFRRISARLGAFCLQSGFECGFIWSLNVFLWFLWVTTKNISEAIGRLYMRRILLLENLCKIGYVLFAGCGWEMILHIWNSKKLVNFIQLFKGWKRDKWIVKFYSGIWWRVGFEVDSWTFIEFKDPKEKNKNIRYND